ncbi:MAG: hypothetical protein WBZ28_24270, partial [Pseudolabrys sp.]
SAFGVRADIALTRWNVRYWHKAGIGLHRLFVCFGGKADIIGPEGQCLLLTQSGHPFQKAGERSPAEAGRR